MRVLIFSWRGIGHPNAGGAEISTHEHAKRWVKAGHNVTLFTSYYNGGKKNEKIDGVNIIRRGDQILGVHVQALKWYLFDSHPQYDVVIDQFHGIPFFTPLFVKSKKLAFVHEVAKEVWKINFSFIPATIGEILEPLIFKFYRNIPFITVSQSTKKDLVNWGIPKENIKIIHNGITTPSLKKLPAKEKIKTLIFLGAISEDKGIEDALEVFAILLKKTKSFKFWVVGKAHPVYLQNLNILTKKFEIGKYVKFWGYVSEDWKFNLLGRSHILINPSIREGWGLVVIEAASVGTPTIAYNVPGLRDSIVDGKTGILCSKNTPDDLANNILKVLNDEERYERISRNSIAWSKNFSWEKASRESLKLVETIVLKR